MKRGIEYFPLDVVLDDKFGLVEAEYGLTGFGVVVKLFQKIYGGQGYYIEWNSEVALLFASRIGVGGNVVSEIISTSIKRGIFDKTLYDRYSVLTSAGIQRRYLEAVGRRKNVELDKRYLLLDISEIGGNVNILNENVNISTENVYISKQSKVKESKVKEKSESKAKFAPPTVEEVKAYCSERKNGINAEYFVNYYTERNWRGVTDWKARIRSWETNGIDNKSNDKPTKTKAGTPTLSDDEAERLMQKALERVKR